MKTLSLFLALGACARASSINIADFVTSHYEAEDVTPHAGCRIDQENFPYVGSGYAVLEGEGATLEWADIQVAQAGIYTLIFKYANGSGADRPCSIHVNGEEVAVLPFPSVYADVCHYWNARLTVKLKGAAT